MKVILKNFLIFMSVLQFESFFIEHAVASSLSSVQHSCQLSPRPTEHTCEKDIKSIISTQQNNKFSFTLKINREDDEPVTSDSFSWGGAKWQVVYFSHGINGSSDHASVYLYLLDGKSAINNLSFKMSLRSADHPDTTIIAERVSTAHSFNKELPKTRSWGFSRFCSCDSTKMFEQVTIQVTILPEMNEEELRSGIVNVGNTCYMNSVLQLLFHIKAFREGVVKQTDSTSQSTELASIRNSLSSLFASMLHSHQDITTDQVHPSTVPLCKAMNILPPYQQEDAIEFKSNLLYRLSELQSEDGKSLVADLFEGSFTNSIHCQHVNFSKSWEEPFLEIAVDVSRGDGIGKGSTLSSSPVYDVMQALSLYFEEEMMVGENAYHAKGFGKQSAVKSVKIKQPPKVLHIQLKRFAYQDGKISKLSNEVMINNELDLSPFISTSGFSSLNNTVTYKLHAVLIHTGQAASSGHYYSYVATELGKLSKLPNRLIPVRSKRSLKEQLSWVKFDDIRVTDGMSWDEVLEDGIGQTGAYRQQHSNRFPLFRVPPVWKQYTSPTSAYLLQYIRSDIIEDIL